MSNNQDSKGPEDRAFEQLEYVFSKFSNAKARESNRHPVGDANRVEHDFTERDKEHLSLLRAKLDLEISKSIHSTLKDASASSDRLGRKVFWLNIVLVLLTAVLAGAAVLDLIYDRKHRDTIENESSTIQNTDPTARISDIRLTYSWSGRVEAYFVLLPQNGVPFKRHSTLC